MFTVLQYTQVLEKEFFSDYGTSFPGGITTND